MEQDSQYLKSHFFNTRAPSSSRCLLQIINNSFLRVRYSPPPSFYRGVPSHDLKQDIHRKRCKALLAHHLLSPQWCSTARSRQENKRRAVQQVFRYFSIPVPVQASASEPCSLPVPPLVPLLFPRGYLYVTYHLHLLRRRQFTILHPLHRLLIYIQSPHTHSLTGSGCTRLNNQ